LTSSLCAKFQNEIFRGYHFTVGRIFHFPITACTVVQAVVQANGQWPSQWGWANFPPQPRNRLTDFDEIRILELSSEDHTSRKISFRSDVAGGLDEYPVRRVRLQYTLLV